jgi:hypothetical protein
VTTPPLDPDLNPVALYDTLSCAADAALQLESGDTSRANASLLAAFTAADLACPPGSDLAAALSTVLVAVASVREQAM